MSRRVVITGMGAITPIGNCRKKREKKAAFWIWKPKWFPR